MTLSSWRVASGWVLSIYAKLGVNNRRAAVRRAEALDLMGRVDRKQRPIILHDS